MESSSYYKNQIDKVSDEIHDLKKNVISCTSYIDLLSSLYNLLHSTYDGNDRAYNAFLNGGYLSDGITLDNGILMNDNKILENDLRRIESLTKSISSKISDMEEKISVLNTKLVQLNNNYKEALNAER